MPNLLVDSSAWIALLVGGDDRHDEAVELFTELRAERRRLVTTDHVFDETVTRVRYKVGHKESIFVGETILDAVDGTLIETDASTRAAAWSLFKRLRDQTLSLADCTLIAVLRREGMNDICSFDDDFRRVGVTTIPHRRK